MPETYHDDIDRHLQEQRARIQAGINGLWELENRGMKYLANERQNLVSGIKASCGHSPCPVTDNYMGNPRP